MKPEAIDALATRVMESDAPCVVSRHHRAAADARAEAQAACPLAAMFNRENEARNLLGAVHGLARWNRIYLSPQEALKIAARIAERITQ